MKYKVVIRPEAENDLMKAFSWYEDKRNGLGYDILLQVDAGIRFIERGEKIKKHLTNHSCGQAIACRTVQPCVPGMARN